MWGKGSDELKVDILGKFDCKSAPSLLGLFSIRAISGGTEGSNRFSSPVYYPKCVFPWRLTSLIRVNYGNMVISSPLLQSGEGRGPLGAREKRKSGDEGRIG